MEVLENQVFTTIDPTTGKKIAEHPQMSDQEAEKAVQRCHEAFKEWKTRSFEERAKIIKSIGKGMQDNKKELTHLMTQEMGKPISQSVAEIEKCAWVCEYYAKNAENQLQDEIIETDADESYVRYEPLGAVLAIMPWNYPFWQVFRFAAPAVMAGNVALLKHELPDLTVMEIPGASHALPRSQHNAFNAAIIGFAQRVGG
mgnify:CR=1 FL=1